MKIEPIDAFKSLSGKICQHSDMSVNYNRSSGIMHSSKMCNPYEGPASAKQIAQQEKFTAFAQKVSAWLNANKPSATNGEKGTEAYQEALRIKKELMKSNIRQVICLYMNKETGVVTLPSSGASSAPASGGGGGSTPSGGGGDGGF